MNIDLPPLSSRFCEGIATKNEWLIQYYQFREANAHSKQLKQQATAFQSAMGKNSSALANKFRGCLLGLAVGDALGTTLEFSARQPEESHTEMVGKGPFNLKPGKWTDDTSMALCLAYSLATQKSFDEKDQMRLYLDWWKNGLFSSTHTCFDIGNTVASALSNFERTGEPFSGSTDEYSAGNGSLMRLAPVVLFYASNDANAISMAGQSSKTTHGNIQAVDSCRYFAALILGALKNSSKDEILDELYTPIEGYWDHAPLCKQVENIAKGSFKNKSRDEIESTGYVIHSLEAALWAFYHSNSFEEGLIKAVNLAGDSDTIGAIYGQLAGAYYGEFDIPFRWIKPLTNFYYFYYFADEFVSYYSGKAIQTYKDNVHHIYNC